MTLHFISLCKRAEKIIELSCCWTFQQFLAFLFSLNFFLLSASENLVIMYRNYLSFVSSDFKKRLNMKKSTEVKRIYKSKMESEFITISKVPIRVDSWGGYLPSKILDKSQEKPKELILMIPGNPGVTKFYEKFLNHLYEKTKKPIWILSHGGHDKINKKLPSLKKNKNLYTLQGQIDQKDEFIQTYLEGVTLYYVGHSIGCKMLLELLNTDKKSFDVEKCIMLFPAIERLAETPNASYVKFVINYILWLTLFGSWIFVYLPKIIQYSLIRVYCFVVNIPPNNIPAIWQLIDPHVLNKVFFLAHDEMKTVKGLNDEVFKLHGHKIKMYYGATDGWAPLNYYKELKEKYKNVDAELCSKGYQHTFVLKESRQIAELVSMWLKK